MTFLVYGLDVISPNRTVFSEDRIGFRMMGSATALPSRLVDLGDIRVEQTGEGVHAIGVLAGSRLLGSDASFEIGASGSMEVSSTGDGGWAYGVLASRLANFTNAGALKVTADDQALAVVMGDVLGEGPFVHVVNDGVIEAVGKGYALGLDIANGFVENNGKIIAHGSQFNNYGVSLFDRGGLINTGLIAAHASDRSDYSAVAVYIDLADGGANSIVNSGELRGALAIQANNYSLDPSLGLTLDNSGRIFGDLQLSTGNDSVANTGSILGRIGLGDGDDTYDGHQGAGFDLVIGGGGADRMTAGHGDRFAFAFTSESDLLAPDTILAVDKSVVIDLSAIDANVFDSGDQRFHLVGHLTGNEGELTVSYDASTGVAKVMGDVDGDGQADLVIELQGKAAAHFDNFVL